MNWQTLIQDLQGSGLTQQQIAEEVGCRQSFISELAANKKGKRLCYKIGKELERLHFERCAEDVGIADRH